MNNVMLNNAASQISDPYARAYVRSMQLDIQNTYREKSLWAAKCVRMHSALNIKKQGRQMEEAFWQTMAGEKPRAIQGAIYGGAYEVSVSLPRFKSMTLSLATFASEPPAVKIVASDEYARVTISRAVMRSNLANQAAREIASFE